MTSQQVLFAETIAGMKKAFKRKAYDSDSDSEIESYGNRGHKLQRRARFAHRGQLIPTEGPSAYKEEVDYAGVRRSIIHRNPPLVDWEGYEVDSDDDDDRIEEAMASAAELDPYANIRLEMSSTDVLAPLTASTDLPNHPTLSQPFTSQSLTNLVQHSSAMMRRENASLWKVRHLWTALCGDHIWIPCEAMLAPNDVELYTDDHVARHLLSLSKGTTTVGEDGRKQGDAQEETNGDEDVSMSDPVDENNNRNAGPRAPGARRHGDEKPKEEGDDGGAHGLANGHAAANEPADANRAPASMVSEGTEKAFVHPMFLPPAGSKADRNLGVPENEAEDVRRLLSFFVQKQEEVCRGAHRLYEGLTKAQRLRRNVLHWSKAEAHSGENRDMSDGEDWYDKEEWGLTEDLKKGQDDEEEDTTTTSKKTRTRR
ncbi:RXT2-like, N-terminal [Geosmithia morbida]|uniref:RXT2-like, N-terminal n=1 Tax=Geosmithia morbida TaxID=1094350 RepID=A0A9P4Z1J9_9HYPO|nr:RXT2-like, N-terminal [Geosmithia morbida]KAF4125593.1 RXT2-like, N-terminal [Geosmithia morbida]